MSSPVRHPVYVHIGEAKTGTTYLQNLLQDNRGALLDAGLLYPETGGSGHVYEALALRRVRFRGDPDPRVEGAWLRVVDTIEQWQGPALLSSELFAPARPVWVDRLFDSLDFADVHVIWTVRDMARQLPAAWQEWIKNNGRETFAEWLTAIHDPEGHDGDAGMDFWRLHDTAGILARWAAHVTPDRVHVVTVPPAGSDPSLLWSRFAQVLGIDPDTCRQPSGHVYSSLGAAEVSVVHSLNLALQADGLPWPDYDKHMKWWVSTELAQHRSAPIELPEAEYEWAATQSRETIAAIEAAGYHVVGDLADLVPTRRPTGMDPAAVPAELRAEVALLAATRLVHRLSDVARQADELRRIVDEHRALPPVERTKRLVVELSDDVRWLGAARRGWRRVRRTGRG